MSEIFSDQIWHQVTEGYHLPKPELDTISNIKSSMVKELSPHQVKTKSTPPSKLSWLPPLQILLLPHDILIPNLPIHRILCASSLVIRLFPVPPPLIWWKLRSLLTRCFRKLGPLSSGFWKVQAVGSLQLLRCLKTSLTKLRRLLPPLILTSKSHSIQISSANSGPPGGKTLMGKVLGTKVRFPVLSQILSAFNNSGNLLVSWILSISAEISFFFVLIYLHIWKRWCWVVLGFCLVTTWCSLNGNLTSGHHRILSQPL